MSVIACPTCEYQHGHVGQCVAQPDGLLTCNICKSNWRDLNKFLNTDGESITRSQPFITHSALAGAMDCLNPRPLKPADNTRVRSGIWALSTVLFGVLIILLAGGGYRGLVSGNFSGQAKIQSSALILENIKVEDHNNNQAAFWVITARISNKSVHTVTVPTVLMRSGNKGSSGYFGWSYTPALQKLSPGTNLIIRTSIHKPFGSSKNIEMEFADNNFRSG